MSMAPALYVPTDATGVEHAADGRIPWQLPIDGRVGETHGPQLVLRPSKVLLNVLDERIWYAEAAGEPVGKAERDGSLCVGTARLVAETAWNVESATHFALSCAERAADRAGVLGLPDGTLLADAVGEARRVLDETAPEHLDRLGYLARVRALRRMRRERFETTGLSVELLGEDEARDAEALDDPDYEAVITVIDSVLAAIEAVHHHVLPHLYVALEEGNVEHAEHRMMDRRTPTRAGTVRPTPWGPQMTGAHFAFQYEPAWAAARDAARHARLAARDRSGPRGEEAELAWQAAELDATLGGA